MNVFWDSNCVAPWDCWSICDFECMSATPSNQTPESGHKQLLKKIPGMFKSSTSFVVNKMLPQLALMDGLSIPNILNFEVTMVPTHSSLKCSCSNSLSDVVIVYQTVCQCILVCQKIVWCVCLLSNYLRFVSGVSFFRRLPC